jgi:hypothetical protein
LRLVASYTQMTMTTKTSQLPTELAYRVSDGLEVWLLWTRATNRVFVLVVDSRVDDSFELDVSGDEALDAFHHPYAYASFHGVSHRPTARRRATTLCA